MGTDVPESIKALASKRRVFRLGRRSFSFVHLTPEESDYLCQFAEEQGLLTRYEFSGISSYGVNRNHAAERLLKDTRQKAFEMMRRVFGSSAYFRRQSEQTIGIDFYWKKARLAVVITGPLWDDVSRGTQNKARDSRPHLGQHFESLPQTSKIVKVPYYVVWHRPAHFLDQIRHELVASGQYSRLLEKK